MAEVVQQRIEEMLPELEQMKRIELFTEKETRAILKKRKAYEYKLRRKTKQKEDFLQYIQYEMNVLSLVKKRRKKTGLQFKKFEIDFAIINRIHKLFQSVCFRFSNDANLWLSYIDFCKKWRENAPVGNLYIKMLQVHNRKPELWVLAAKWELEENLSMENARILLQRGLRYNSKSEHLWQEYFRMELLNADKLRKRREILGLAALSKEEVGVSHEVLEGKVAVVVFKKAVDAVPENVEFCLSFLPICRLFEFAQDVEEEIFSYLRVRYPANELTWEAVALRSLKKPAEFENVTSKKERERMCYENELEVAAVFEKALQEVNTEKMWTLYINFCYTRLMKKSSRKLCDKRAARLLNAFQQAAVGDKLSAELYSQWIEVLCHVGQTAAAWNALGRGLARHPHCLSLWLTKLKFVTARNPSVEELTSVVDEALNNVKEEDSYPIYEIALSWAKLCCPQYADRLLEQGVMKRAEVSVPLKTDYLNWALFNKGKQRMREIYASLSATQPLSIDFFQTYINIEKSQAKPSVKRIRQAYEDAIQCYGATNVELWLDYIRMETTQPKGKPHEAGQIYWRAMKTLSGELTEKFVTLYTLLQTGKL